ncbi:MAG TPA: ABC transporter ATP-binding protein [Firmicutes bacterium]|nr:ABC transporter ATP-binding protein [Bacillota bacterium]
MTLLNADSISLSFGGVAALSDVSLAIQPGEVHSLIGPNGAGKTTMFNVVTCIYRPQCGTLTFRGENIIGLKPHQVTKMGMARTFQNIRLFGSMTVLDNVIVAACCRSTTGPLSAMLGTPGMKREAQKFREKALNLLEFIGLSEHAEDVASSLPYGLQRRLEIARALATDPELILLDEPTAGMNDAETMQLIQLIAEIRNTGKAVLLIEHDMKVVMNVSDKITVLDRGKKIAEGPPSLVAKDPAVIKAYLGQEL